MAAGNNATLQVEVVSKGIADTVRKLDSLGNAAARNEAKVVKLTDSLNKLMLAQDSAVSKAVQHSNLMAAIAQSMSQVSNYASATARSVQSLNASLNALTAAAAGSNQALDTKAKKTGVIVTTVRAMTAAFMAYTSINLVKSIIQGADAWQMMQARMTVATGSLNNAKVAQEEMFELSQKLRVPLEETGRLYTRLAPAMRNLGKSSKETREMVEGVATALQLSGATGAETASVMLQFSQAMQAGRLNGAEFNAVAEGAPKILEALEKATGKNRGELKKMGSEGKLSVELIQEAMQKALPQWREDFAKLPITADSALTRIKNAWLKAMGELNENTGFSDGIVRTLKVIEDLIPKIRDELVAAFVAVGAWIDNNRTALGEVWDQVKGLIKDVWNIGAALSQAAGQAAGLGNEFSIFGFAIFTVRLALAGVQDGFVAIGAAILKLSYPLMKGLIEPLAFVATSLLQIIVEAIDRITYGLGKAAKFAGFDGLGDGLLSVSDFMENISDKLENAKYGIFKMGEAMNKAGDEAIAYLASGNSAVQQLLKGEEAITDAVKERLKYQENANPNPKKPVNEEDAKATAKAQEDARKELEKTVAAYHELIKAKEQLEKYGLDGDKRTAFQKEQFDLEKKLAEAKTKTERASLQQALNINLHAQGVEKEMAALKDKLDLEDKHRKTMEQKIKAATDEAIATEYKVQTYGMLKGAIEALELKAEEEVLRTLRANNATKEAIALQEQLVLAKQRGAEASAALGAKEAEAKAIEDIDKLLDPGKALAFGDALSQAFGNAGNAIGKLTKAFDEMAGKQEKMSEAREKLFDIKDPKKFQERMTALSHKEAKDRINAYGDMAGAAKGFFKEGSKGYKIMEGAEKAFRMVEMALAMEAYVRKTFFTQAEATAVVAAEQVKTAATVQGATAGAQASMVEGQAAAVAGVANQAKGDPYSAWVRMALMAATMAALGFAVSGGAGGSTPKLSEQRQKVQGTGTVLGDDTAKSKSISNSLELLRENSDIALRHSSAMLAALQNIRDGIAGMARFVAQSSGLRGTKADEIALGVGESRGRGAFGTGAFGSKRKTEMIDSGILFAAGQSVGSMINDGVAAQSYADMKKTKKKWYGKTKTSYYTVLGELDQDLLDQIGMTVESFTEGIVTATEALGANGEAIYNQLMNFVPNLDKLSLQGLKGDEIVAELEAVFGAMGDDMARWVFGGLDEFQRLGEGYFQTLVRVANGVEVAKYELDRLGIAMIDYAHVTNKQGDVAAEIIRDSLLLREAGSSISILISEIQGGAQDIVNVYKQLVDVRSMMEYSGMGTNLTRSLLYGAGGLDNLQDAMKGFVEDFYTDTEKQAMATRRLAAEFGKLGLAVPKTREEFRALVTSLILGGEATQAMAGMVLNLAETFTEAQSMAEDLVSAARDNLSDAYERERDVLEETKNKFEEFAASLLEFKSSLMIGAMSPMTNAQKYAEITAQYNDIVNKARAGDEAAIGKFQSVANEFLRISREYNASGDAYTADFNSVLTETTYLAAVAETQADIAAQSLEALNKQVEGLLELNNSVMTVVQAIEALHAAMAAAGMAIPPSLDGSHANGLSYVPFDGYTAELHKGEAVLTAAENQAYQSGRTNDSLVSEIKALRAEVNKLREEQAEQTVRVIGANYDANERNAERVVEGTSEAADKAAWRSNTNVNLV